MSSDIPPAAVQDFNVYDVDKRPAIVYQLAQSPHSTPLDERVKQQLGLKPCPRELVERAIKLYEEKGKAIKVGYAKTAGEYISVMGGVAEELAKFDFKGLSEKEKDSLSSIFGDYALASQKAENNFKKSEKYNLLALKLTPKGEASLVNLGLLYFMDLKDYEKALQVGETLLKYYPGHRTGTNLVKRSKKELGR